MTSRAAGTGTILLVEDEPAIRQLVAVALTRAGYRVIEARNGREAVRLFDETVDLLLTDMRMPYVGGQQLIAELRQKRRTLKVMSFSGYPRYAPDDPDITFIEKPFSQSKLLAAVRDVFARVG